MATSLEILKKYWGYVSFRPSQPEIIDSVISGNDTLALLPTGGGKSICFQVPALMLEGICLVVSPLIALMKDQVAQLNNRGIPARAIYSGMSPRAIDITLDNCIYGEVKFLYLSPERLKTDIFRERSKKMNVSLLAVDEAHCISQWGYDFRPPYLDIAQFKESLPKVTTIALTATATPLVQKDIIERLKIEDVEIFRKSFARKNLSYSVFQKEDKETKLLEILYNVPGSGVVYVKSRKRAEVVAKYLLRNGISADFYHAGLNNAIRSQKQEDWISHKTRIIVATNAFGMGIDKSDVRTVVHLDVPDSLENYYQEAGRAGRDEERAFAVLLYNRQDLHQLAEQLEASFPTIESLGKCYQAIANYYQAAVGSNYMEAYDFDLEDFSRIADYRPLEAYRLVKKLEEYGLIQLSESFYQSSRIHFSVTKADLYKYEVGNPKMEGLIKAILRLCGGEAFTDYVDIRESQLGNLTGKSMEEVRKGLEYLDTNGLLKYEKQKNKPQLTFLTPRLDRNKLGIDQQELAERKKAKTSQIEAIKAYTISLDRCRTRTFQEYFGESVYDDCGHCDYCLRRKKAGKIKDPEKLRASILEELSLERSLDELQRRLTWVSEDDYISMVRMLLEEGLIIYSELGRLRRV